MAAGNAIGCCIFNLLGVVAVMALASDSSVPVSNAVLRFDMPMMLVAATLCLPIADTGFVMSRREGVILLLVNGGYIAFLVADAMAGAVSSQVRGWR